MTAAIAADAAVRISLDGMAEIKGELTSLKSEIAGALATNNKFAAVSAMADGFRMLSGTIQSVVGLTLKFTNYLREGAERISDIQKVADRLGTDVKFISQIRIGAIASNMGLNELEQAFAAFQRNMETFSQGVGESKQTFENLGITPDMLRGWGSLENQMFGIIQRLGQIQDPSQRAGAAMRIFGEQGRKLIPLVNANAGALFALMQTADFLGASFDENLGRKADYFRDSLRLLGTTAEGIFNRIADGSLPLVNKMMDDLIVGLKTFSDAHTGVTEWEDSLSMITEAIGGLGKSLLGLEVYIKRVEAGFFSLMHAADSFAGLTDPMAAARAPIWDMMADRSQKALSELMDDLASYDANFAANMEQWRQLRQQGLPGSEDVANAAAQAAAETDAAAEKLKSAADILAKAFKGEAIGRTAANQAKLREMNEAIFKDMRTSLRSINNALAGAPVVRTLN